MPSPKPLLLFLSIALAVPIICQTSKAQSPDAKVKPTGSISGRIMISGKAAAGIEVAAFGGESINRRIPAAQTKTDSEGYYHLGGLTAGNYQITTFSANLTSAEPNSEYPYGFAYFGSSKGVLLAAGEEVTNIDIKLVRGGVISGRVTDADKPVVEERVSLQPIVDGGNRISRPPLPIGQMYQTDDRGFYRIYGLPAGRYKVSAGQDASRGSTGSSNGYYQLTYHPDVTDPNKATIIELPEGGEASNADIHLGRREETYAITGRIIDSETGLPVSGARVGVMVSRGEGFSSASSGIPTGTDGKFNVPALISGRYGVYVASDYGESDFYSDPVYVDITDKDISGLEIRAIRGLSISGTIVAENMELKGLLRQLPGLRVSANIVPPDGRMTPSTLRSFGSATIAADGSFQITGLRPGRAQIGISAPDPSKRASIVKVAVGGVGVTQGFEIEPGQSVTGVQVVIAYGTGAIRGSVTFQGGTAATFRTEIICRREATRSFVGGATLDARGHFLISGLAPGTYDCGLQYINLGATPGRRLSQPQHQSVTVSNDAEAEVNFVVDLEAKGVGP